MAKGFEELDEWVRGLESMEKNLSDLGSTLFHKHEIRYLSLAQRVGGQFLLGCRPDGIDDQEWSDRVADFVELVLSRIGKKSFEIFYEGRTDEDGVGKPGKEITYDDVLSWVRAGPENGGKDKTAIENNRGRADEQIAYDVHQAIKQQRLGFAKKDYSGITERLERWVDHGVLVNHLSDLLPFVLDVWFATLEPVLENDFEMEIDDVLSW
jgi:hypothetical protein